jgi:Cu/Ag efflux pump CusA
LPQGYRIEWTGEFEEVEEAQNRLFVAVPPQAALCVVQLRSRSLIVIAGIPFAVGGGIQEQPKIMRADVRLLVTTDRHHPAPPAADPF